jgi:UDP-GlcNAc:undecaprenyl-phosphate GlcNAc-1-phosphate transferase
LYFAALLLAAGVVGFLPFNFPRARIFMGDVGSQFCGFVLAVLGIVASRFDHVPMSFVLVPLLLFGVLYDVAFTLVRRLSRGERITTPHRGHLYQVAHRAFVLFGGSCALAFIHATSAEKPLILLLPLFPQLVWTMFVWRTAVIHNLGRW